MDELSPGMFVSILTILHRTAPYTSDAQREKLIEAIREYAPRQKSVCKTCNGTRYVPDPDFGFDPWLNLSGEIRCPDCIETK